MGGVADLGAPHNCTQLIKAQPVDEAFWDTRLLRHELCQILTEGGHILQDLNDQIDELQFACAPLPHRLRHLPFQGSFLVTSQKLRRMLEFMAENVHNFRQTRTIIDKLKVVTRHSRPTTASIAFFMVAVVNGFRTILFRPSCCPFWTSSGVGVPVTRI